MKRIIFTDQKIMNHLWKITIKIQVESGMYMYSQQSKWQNMNQHNSTIFDQLHVSPKRRFSEP